MSNWTSLCPLSAAPADGEVAELDANGTAICLARSEGRLHAMDNWCPHRQGPLGQGTLEGDAVLCPWHAWAFGLEDGICTSPQTARVAIFPVRVEGEEVLIDLGEPQRG